MSGVQTPCFSFGKEKRWRRKRKPFCGFAILEAERHPSGISRSALSWVEKPIRRYCFAFISVFLQNF